MPEPREAVRRMRPYYPPTGGRHDKLRLDFNENTVGCSPRVAAFLREAMSQDLLATYHDYEEPGGLLDAFFGVQREEMLLTNGTDEAIQVLVNAFVEAGDEVIVLTPSYAMYRFYAEVAGVTIIEVPYGLNGGKADLSFNLSKLLAALSPRTKAILLSNPNNPTGTVILPQDIVTILNKAAQACVLVDEAYFEFYGRTILPRINDFANLFVSRTFSKAYGMAAMRMGCLFSCAENAAVMKKAQSPYSVNMLAALAATEAIKDAKYTNSYVASALAGRGVITDLFDSLQIPYWPSEANFVLFDAGRKADECLARCRAEGVLIRDRRHEIEGALRVTAGPPEQMERFLSVVNEVYG